MAIAAAATSAPNPKFALILLQQRLRTSGSKGALESSSASVPLIPKFASEVAARMCELRNRDTKIASLASSDVSMPDRTAGVRERSFNLPSALLHQADAR